MSNRDVFIHARSFKHLRGSAEPIVRLDLLRSTVSVISVYRTSGRLHMFNGWNDSPQAGVGGGVNTMLRRITFTENENLEKTFYGKSLGALGGGGGGC